MDAVDREELIGLLAEALMRDRNGVYGHDMQGHHIEGADTRHPTAARRQMRGSRIYSSDGRDRGVAVLLASAAQLLGRLPAMVLDHRRPEVAGTLAAAPTIIVEITPGIGVRIKSGERLLLDIPASVAATQVRRADRWSRVD